MNSDQKAKENSGCGCGYASGFGCGGFLLGVVFTAISLPAWINSPEQGSFISAKVTLGTILKECALKRANGEKNPRFIVPESLTNLYTITPLDGDCNGDKNNLIIAYPYSEFASWFPTFSINVITGERSAGNW